MTLVCLAFLISLHSRLFFLSPFYPPTLAFLALFRPSLFLPVLRSFSFLSVCLGVLSLIRAFGPSWRPTPLNSSMSALHLHCLFTATSMHCYWHCPTPQCFILLTLTYLLLLAAASAAAASVTVFFFCVWLGLCLLSLQSVHVNVKWNCNSAVYVALC